MPDRENPLLPPSTTAMTGAQYQCVQGLVQQGYSDGGASLAPTAAGGGYGPTINSSTTSISISSSSASSSAGGCTNGGGGNAATRTFTSTTLVQDASEVVIYMLIWKCAV